MVPIAKIVRFWADREPDRPFITQDGRTLSRAAFDEWSNGVAHELRARDVAPGDFVTIALPNCLEYFAAAFAIWKAGAIPQPVSHMLPRREIDAIINLVGPKLVLGDIEAATASLSRAEIANTPGNADPVPDVPIARYWKAMTSGGSTGRPKVIVDHMEAEVDPDGSYIGQPNNGVILNPGPLYHNAPFSVTFFALFHGNHVVSTERFDAETSIALIDQHKVQWVTMVPTMMQRIWNLPEETRTKYDLSSLQALLHLAAPCPPWLKENWINWIGPERVFELYGGTERQGVTIISGTEWLERRGSVGKVVPGFEMKIFDENGRECPPGEVGEIFFLPEEGRGTTYHYIGAEPKAKGDWESIGDLGWVDEDGYLYLADRRTDLIVSGGANIYPAEVEAALDAHPNILSSAVIGLPHEDLGQAAHAIIQVQPNANPTEDDLKAFLAEEIVRYKIPRSFEFVGYPIRDDAGKVRRSQLRDERIT